MRAEWTGAKRFVVKIGSSLLVDSKSGTLKAQWLASLCDDIAKLKAQGKHVIVVSSGAIALGRNVLKLPKGALKLEDSQAAAAVGQIALAHASEDEFRARLRSIPECRQARSRCCRLAPRRDWDGAW